MVSRLPKDRTLEMEDRWKIKRQKKYSPPVPHLLQAQQALILLYMQKYFWVKLEKRYSIFKTARSMHYSANMQLDIIFFLEIIFPVKSA